MRGFLARDSNGNIKMGWIFSARTRPRAVLKYQEFNLRIDEARVDEVLCGASYTSPDVKNGSAPVEPLTANRKTTTTRGVVVAAGLESDCDLF